MKNLFLTTFILSSFHLLAQEEEKILTFVEEEAEYPGGTSEMLKFLQANLKYPEEAWKAGIQGRAMIRFVIEKDGSVTTVKVARGVPNCPKCDAEAVRVIKLMPKWIPGKSDGKTVRSYFNMPITFKLDDPEEKKSDN